MIQDPITVSLVCPAFNEEQVLPLFHEQLLSVISRLPADYKVEIVYVDDGSQDQTLACLRTWAARDDRVRYLSLSRNFGHQMALTAGLEAARGDVVITMDADLQHPPALIPRLLEAWHAGSEVVITIRDDGSRTSWFEQRFSRWFYQLMSWLSDTDIRPAAADFRLLSRPAVDALLRMRESHRFLRGMVQWMGFPASEIHYTPAQRGAGQSKYTLRRKLRLALDGILSFSKLPLRLPIPAGLAAMAFGLLTLLYAFLATAVWVPQHDQPTSSTTGEPGVLAPGVWSSPCLLGSLYLLGGSILCCLGFLGEYVGRIYDQVRGRPFYLVKEQSAPPEAAVGRIGNPSYSTRRNLPVRSSGYPTGADAPGSPARQSPAA